MFPWPAVLGAGVVVLFYVSPGLVMEDVPRLLGITVRLSPWKWDWLRAALLLAETGALALSLAAFGLRVLALWPRSSPGREERLLFGLALGAGVSGLLILGLGLAGLLQRRLLIGIFLLAVANVASLLDAFVKRSRKEAGLARGPQARRREIRTARIVFLLALLWCALFVLPDLLAPEAFWDAIVYHLGAPKRFLETHKVTLTYPFFSQLPLLVPMNYLLCLSLEGERLARGLNLVFGLAVVAAVRRLAREKAGEAGAWMVAALVLTLPLLVLLAVHAGADTGAALLSVLALGAFLAAAPRWPRGPVGKSGLLLAGLLAGLAASAKLSAGATAVMILLLAVPFGLRETVLVALPAIAVFLPWGARAWLFTGNPVFPLFDAVFHSAFWHPFTRETYAHELIRIPAQFGIGDFSPLWLHKPLIARFKLGLLGPVSLLAILAALAPGFRRSVRLPVLVFIAGLAAVWAFSVPAYRFFAPGFALLPLLVAVRVRGFASVPVYLCLGLHMLWLPLVLHQVDRPWVAARGETSREVFYESLHVNSSFDAFHRLETHLGTGPAARTLAVGEVRNFLAPAFTIVPSYFEPSLFLLLASEAGDSQRLRIRLKQRAVRYLLVNVPEVLRLTTWEGLCWKGPMPFETLEAFFRRHSRLIFARRAAWLYEIGERKEGAVVPECFWPKDMGRTRSLLASVSESSRALHAGEKENALKRGWSAVAADDSSGLAWTTLGDALLLSGRNDTAVGAYEKALALGWRTSSSYHNYGVCLAREKNSRLAHMAMGYALELDPEVMRLRRDFQIVEAEYYRPLHRLLNEP